MAEEKRNGGIKMYRGGKNMENIFMILSYSEKKNRRG